MSSAGPDRSGWLDLANRVDSPNFDARPPDPRIDVLVLQYIRVPPGYFSGDAIERFFCNRLDPKDHPFYAQLKGVRVSSHFLIRRHGGVRQFVDVDQRAWHAGSSQFHARTRCNDFSVGIEIEGDEHRPFTDAQYRKLALLVAALRERLPLQHVAGHSDIAPTRKFDPGPQFDWRRFMKQPAARGLIRYQA